MRVTSLPTAPIAPAPVALLLPVLLALFAAPSSARAERWLRPLPGEVTRAFSYSRAAPFAAGAHRGVDIAGDRGATVRAACSGRVVHAGPVPSGGAAVTLRCRARRVTHLPLAAVAVRVPGRVRAGTRIGTLAAGHRGRAGGAALHLGVRRAGDPFGYEDPLAFFGSEPEPHAPLVPPSPRRIPRPLVVPRPLAPAPLAPAPLAPAPLPPTPLAPAVRPAPAPPLVWGALAAALLGAFGTGAVSVRRRRRAAREASSAIAGGARVSA